MQQRKIVLRNYLSQLVDEQYWVERPGGADGEGHWGSIREATRFTERESSAFNVEDRRNAQKDVFGQAGWTPDPVAPPAALEYIPSILVKLASQAKAFYVVPPGRTLNAELDGRLVRFVAPIVGTAEDRKLYDCDALPFFRLQGPQGEVIDASEEEIETDDPVLEALLTKVCQVYAVCRAMGHSTPDSLAIHAGEPARELVAEFMAQDFLTRTQMREGLEAFFPFSRAASNQAAA